MDRLIRKYLQYGIATVKRKRCRKVRTLIKNMKATKVPPLKAARVG